MVNQTWPRFITWQKSITPALLGLGLLGGQPAWGHGAMATVTRTYTVEATYASGEPMAQAQVVVYSSDQIDEPWLTGTTDGQGNFEFRPDQGGNWEVVIRQAGHGTTVTVPVANVPTVQGQTEGSDHSEPDHSRETQVISTAVSTPLQRWASAGAGLWGLVGTALFFSRNNSRSNSRGKQSS